MGFSRTSPTRQTCGSSRFQPCCWARRSGARFCRFFALSMLKVGMTVSASIPVAVLAITLFRAFSRAFGLRQATILENNIVQTAGSAGESIAFGAGVTMPALLLLGFRMDLQSVMVVSRPRRYSRHPGNDPVVRELLSSKCTVSLGSQVHCSTQRELLVPPGAHFR